MDHSLQAFNRFSNFGKKKRLRLFQRRNRDGVANSEPRQINQGQDTANNKNYVTGEAHPLDERIDRIAQKLQ